MRSLSMRPRDYSLDGLCVYCRRDLSALSAEEVRDEHIIPRALNGSLVIKGGACSTCTHISDKSYQQAALDTDLLVARRLLEQKPSVKREPQPGRDLRPVAVERLAMPVAGSRGQQGDGAVPRRFSLVVFEQAGMLVGVDRTGDLKRMELQLFDFGGHPNDPGKPIRPQAPILDGPFALMLAKIAYCYAMAEFGERHFDAGSIRDLLFGRRRDVYNFVGNTPAAERLSQRQLHGLYVRRRDEWLTVLVHLFASCHSTAGRSDCRPYEVVVGRAL